MVQKVERLGTDSRGSFCAGRYLGLNGFADGLGLVLPACALRSAAMPASYVIDKNFSIDTSDGATLCALVVRPATAVRLPTALEFTIYV